MTIELSCAFATSPGSREHARIAEALGYRRAFFFDSPTLYPDVWVQLCVGRPSAPSAPVC